VQWCERLTLSAIAGRAVYSIINWLFNYFISLALTFNEVQNCFSFWLGLQTCLEGITGLDLQALSNFFDLN
jgi:hypothetical protein